MSITLYRKWRPQQWEEIIGQEHVIKTLRNSVATNHFAHAFIFSGPRGTGKTTTARLLAKAVNCLVEDASQRPCESCVICEAVNKGKFMDLIEIDAASNTSVDDVRDLREKINFSPNQGRYKVYIVDEVHMLSTAAFNALLKTLEEPPAHAIFVLATTEVHKIPATVLSRCQRHEFRRIPVVDILQRLKHIVEEEKIEAETDALTLIARQATGSLRDAISLLDQLASSGQPINLDWAAKILGTVTAQSILDMVDALIAGDTTIGLEVIHQNLDSGGDPRVFSRQVVEHFRNILLTHHGHAGMLDVPAEQKHVIARHAQLMNVTQTLSAIRAFNQATNDLRLAWQPSLPLEIAFLETCNALNAEPEDHLPTAGSIPAGSGAKGGQVETIPKQATKSPPVTRPAMSPPLHQENLPKSDEENKSAENEADTQLFKRISEGWREFLQQVRQRNSQAQALLNSSRPYAVKGYTLYLGFNGDFAKNKMEREGSLELVQAVFQEALGIPLVIKCFVTGQKKGELPPEVDRDGMVASIVRDLGGEIVDIQ